MKLVNVVLLIILILLSISCATKELIFSEEEKLQLASFIDSIHLRNKAMSLLHEIPTEISREAFSPENFEKVEEALSLMKESIDESQQVDDELLLELHPELSGHYREEFCEGLKLYIKYFEAENGILYYERARSLMDSWGKWFVIISDEIFNKSEWFLNEFANRQDEFNISKST